MSHECHMIGHIHMTLGKTTNMYPPGSWTQDLLEAWHLLGNDQLHNQVHQKDAMSSLAWHLADDI